MPRKCRAGGVDDANKQNDFVRGRKGGQREGNGNPKAGIACCVGGQVIPPYLVLWLRHVRRKVREASEAGHAVASVRVDGVVALVHLDDAEPVGGPGLVCETVVFVERLDRRLCDQDV